MAQTYTRTESLAPGQRDLTVARFFIETVEDPIASAQTGRPCFKDEERVELIMPGNNYNRPVQRVTQDHKERWPREYEAFQKGITICADGIPLEEWPRLRRSQIMELKALGFQTVEQVANMDDQAAQRVGMGGMQLRNLARAFTDDAERNAQLEIETKKSDRLEMLNAGYQRQIDELKILTDRQHEQIMQLQNRQPEAETSVPSDHDPIERAKRNPAPEVSRSSLDSIGEVRPRSRKKA